MLKHILFIIISLSGILLLAEAPTTVEYVDLLRYQGTWYEIAKVPNRFQKVCAKNTTATYKLKEDGNISVINRCIEKSGKVNDIEGVAKIIDNKTNAKLAVSFVRFFWKNWFFGDYWILGIAEDYSWVVVGGPNPKYGWILAREPSISEETMEMAYQIAEEKGYKREDFELSVQELDESKRE